MKLYNSLTRRKEEFVPLHEGRVTMYACGITVSGEAHIGHGYQALVYDVFRNFLQKQGYEVVYARNYTDVDDKIIARSNETGIPADEYARMMIKKIDAIMRQADIGDPTIWLKATENIQTIIDFISALIEKGHAYAGGNGDVYFDVDSYPAYGQLSGRDKEDMLDGVRVENDGCKKNPYDFALWKAAKEGGIALGQGASRLAYRMLRHDLRRVRRTDRYPRRRTRFDLPAPRKRNRAERGAHGQAACKILGA